MFTVYDQNGEWTTVVETWEEAKGLTIGLARPEMNGFQDDAELLVVLDQGVWTVCAEEAYNFGQQAVQGDWPFFEYEKGIK
jgi:hypothetical protein